MEGEDEVASLKERFDAACAAHPEARRPRIMLLHHAYVAEDEQDAVRASHEYSRYFNYFGAWFKNERPIRDGFIEPLSQEEIAANQITRRRRCCETSSSGRRTRVIDRLKRVEADGL